MGPGPYLSELNKDFAKKRPVALTGFENKREKALIDILL